MAAQRLSIKNMFRHKFSSLATLDPTRLEREVGLWRCDWQWKSPIWKNSTETATDAQNVGAIKKTPSYQITEKAWSMFALRFVESSVRTNYPASPKQTQKRQTPVMVTRDSTTMRL